MILVLLSMLSADAKPRDPCLATFSRVVQHDGGTTLRVGYRSRELVLTGDSAVARMQLVAQGMHSAVIQPGFELAFTLVDGTRVTLASVQTAQPSSNSTYVATSRARTTWLATFGLSDEAIHALAQADAVSVLYTVDGEEAVTSFGDRIRREIRTEYACLANHLQR